jgi:hypothetical protein
MLANLGSAATIVIVVDCKKLSSMQSSIYPKRESMPPIAAVPLESDRLVRLRRLNLNDAKKDEDRRVDQKFALHHLITHYTTDSTVPPLYSNSNHAHAQELHRL